MVIAARTTSQMLLHMAVAFGVMYAVTGSAAFGGVAAILEPLCNVILLPLHDRLWKRIAAAWRPAARAISESQCPAGCP